MTSNIGAGSGGHKSVGFASGAASDREKERVISAVKEAFRPEFLNRVDELVVFRRLGEDEIRRIASLILEDIRKRVESLGMNMVFSEGVVSLVAAEGYDPLYGARPLRRAAVRLIEEPLAEAMLTGRIGEGDRVTVVVTDGKAVFEKE